jgi:hypothetical protein
VQERKKYLNHPNRKSAENFSNPKPAKKYQLIVPQFFTDMSPRKISGEKSFTSTKANS